MSEKALKHPSDHSDKGPAFLAIALVFTTLAFCLVLARVYVRVWVKHAFGWDDVFIILATILAIIGTGFNAPEVIAGYGKHLYFLSEADLTQALKWNYLATPLMVLSLASSKISICVFLMRVLNRTSVRFKGSFPIGMIILLTAIAMPSAGYALGQCQPVRKLWNPATPGHCKDPRIFVKVGYAHGTINAFADFALALFPLSFVKDLHLPMHRKVILGLLMSCGVFCGSLAIARTVLTGDLNARSDITYDAVNSSIFAVVEQNVSIIVACVPTLGPALRYAGKAATSITPVLSSIREKLRLSKSKSAGSSKLGTSHDEFDPAKPKSERYSVPIHLSGSIVPPSRAVIHHEAYAIGESNKLPERSSRHGRYGSKAQLIPSGIEKTTGFEVERGDTLV